MRHSSIAALVLAAVPLALAVAQDPAPAPPAQMALPDHMEAFKHSLKTIAMGFQDPQQKDAVLAAASDFQEHAQAAKQLAPSNLDEVPEDERDAHALAYRKSMIALQRALLDLEEKLLDEDTEGVMAMIRGDLFELREAAHDAYQSSR